MSILMGLMGHLAFGAEGDCVPSGNIVAALSTVPTVEYAHGTAEHISPHAHAHDLGLPAPTLVGAVTRATYRWHVASDEIPDKEQSSGIERPPRLRLPA